MAPSQAENASKQKQISAARKRVLKIKRTILKIVEDMLEEEISADWFLQNCSKLCRGDYDDVIQERSIELMCGYPLCSNSIKQTTKQKYHISCTNNKVYELSERKCFCSNECYKASNFIKHQLSSLPLYMRKDSPVALKLISEEDNKGSAGEEIIFQEVIREKEIENVSSTPHPASNFSNILQEELKNCADSFEGLQIKEKIYKNPYIFEHQQKEPKHESLIESDDDNSIGNEDSDEGDEKSFPEHENVTSLSQRLMPVHRTMKKTMLITPFKPCDKTIVAPVENSREFIHKVFQDWMTEDTMKYLLGERKFYAAKADMLFQRAMASNPKDTKKLNSAKNDYIDLCLKLDSLPDDDCYEIECSVTDSIIPKREKPTEDSKHTVDTKTGECKKLPDQNSEKLSKSASENKQVKNKSRKKSKSKSKGVTFALDVKDSNSAATKSRNIADDVNKELKDSSPDPVLPLVDSLSQNALRKQVVIGKLKSVYYDVLPIAGLHYSDIQKSVMEILETFSFTPTNIVFKPKEWKIIAVFLCRILTKAVLKNLHEETKFKKLFQELTISHTMHTEEFEDMVAEITSPQQLHKLQNC